MRNLCILAVLALPSVAAQAQSAAPVEPAPSLSAAECAVWARETSFAQSVATHDTTAFAEHLHPQAVFGAKQPRPTRGRDAIAESWAGLIAGTKVILHWYPAMVAIGGESDIAYANGKRDFETMPAKIPVFYGVYPSIGHGGTYNQDNGGAFGVAAVAWLKWQLMNDTSAKGRGYFVGANCGICTDANWQVQSRGLP